MNKSALIGASALFAALATLYVLSIDYTESQVSERDVTERSIRVDEPAEEADAMSGIDFNEHKPNTSEHGDLAGRANHEVGLENEVAVHNWLVRRGYYSGLGREYHAYNQYDTATLEGLVNAGDALAEQFLADRLYFAEGKKSRAIQLYMSAAASGLTASLVELANSEISDPRSTADAIKFLTEEGSLTDDAANALGYLAAAEFLGDPTATAQLQIILDMRRLELSSANQIHICTIGKQVAISIRETRVRRGILTPPDDAIPLDGWPDPICL